MSSTSPSPSSTSNLRSAPAPVEVVAPPLPYEEEHRRPEHLVYDLTEMVRDEVVTVTQPRVSPAGGVDAAVEEEEVQVVRVGEHTYPLAYWKEYPFNTLGQPLEHDVSRLALRDDQVIDRMNDYSYGVRTPPKILGGLLMGLSFGQAGRHTVTDGTFGVAKSNGRYLFYKTGNHIINKGTHKWVGTIDIDDEKEPSREFGNKTFLSVYDNMAAGAFKILNDADDAFEWVLFPKGRYVINESEYREVATVSLKMEQEGYDLKQLGPLTIAYIGTGFIGCAKNKSTGEYVLLKPGVPYALNERTFENIQVKSIDEEKFTLGPYTFMTIRDGKIGGAHDKHGGYVILPPGQTYCLHSSRYDRPEIKKRTRNFRLGPYQFVTVLHNEVAGVVKKAHSRAETSEFITLPPGKTYQLNQDQYEEAAVTVRENYKVQVGPLTYFTVPKHRLIGAYRHADGEFQIFESGETEYVISAKDYHGLTDINRINHKLTPFGPYNVVTIRDNTLAIMEEGGKFVIREAGTYVLEPQYTLTQVIPLATNTERLNCEFKTNEGVDMAATMTIIWTINKEKAISIAKFNGDAKALRKFILERCLADVHRRCSTYKRSDLCFNKQDLMEDDQEPTLEELEKRTTAAQKRVLALHQHIGDTACDSLVKVLDAAGLGVDIHSISIDGISLVNQDIMDTLRSMTQARLRKRAMVVEGEVKITSAETEKRRLIQAAEADAEVRKRSALADAEIDKQKSIAQAEINRQQALAAAEVKQKQSEAQMHIAMKMAQNEKAIAIERETAKAEAAARALKMEAESRRDVASLQAESKKLHAEAAKVEADAEFYAATKRNEADDLISEKKMAMFMAEHETQRAKAQALAKCQWVEPDTRHRAIEAIFSNGATVRVGDRLIGEMIGGIAKDAVGAEEAAQEEPSAAPRNADWRERKVLRKREHSNPVAAV